MKFKVGDKVVLTQDYSSMNEGTVTTIHGFYTSVAGYDCAYVTCKLFGEVGVWISHLKHYKKQVKNIPKDYNGRRN